MIIGIDKITTACPHRLPFSWAIIYLSVLIFKFLELPYQVVALLYVLLLCQVVYNAITLIIRRQITLRMVAINILLFLVLFSIHFYIMPHLTLRGLLYKGNPDPYQL